MEHDIDFTEPIPNLVQRLRAEPRDFRIELIKIEDASEVSSQMAIEMLKQLKKPILRHTVEEDARIMRIIMQKAKEYSEQSINRSKKTVCDLAEHVHACMRTETCLYIVFPKTLEIFNTTIEY